MVIFGAPLSYTELLQQCEAEKATALEELKQALHLDAETRFLPLEGGLSRAQLYSFEIGGKRYVLRFLALGPSQPKEMRQNEIEALKIGGRLGIAPECVFSDQNAVLVIMPFIEGRTLRDPSDRELIEMGNTIRSLHHFSGDYPTRYTFKRRLERHYLKGLKEGIAYPTGFDREIQAVLNESCSRVLVPSHGDVNPSNILVGKSGIALVDWTNATWDDPFADLSCFCLLAYLSPVQERIFLEAYFGRVPTEEECKVLQQEKVKVYLLTASIWIRFSETPEERALPMEQRVATLDRELDSPMLKKADDYLREGAVADLRSASTAEIRSYALSFYKAYLESR